MVSLISFYPCSSWGLFGGPDFFSDTAHKMEITWVDRFCFLWGEIFNCLKCFKGVVGRWSCILMVRGLRWFNAKVFFFSILVSQTKLLLHGNSNKQFSVYQGDLFYIYIIYYICPVYASLFRELQLEVLLHPCALHSTLPETNILTLKIRLPKKGNSFSTITFQVLS